MGFCSWCCGWKNFGVRIWCSSERNWLIALNCFILVSGATLALMAAAGLSYFGQRVVDRHANHAEKVIYNTFVGLAILSGVQVTTSMMGIIAAERIRLHLMVVYFWLISLLVGAVIILSYAALAFQNSFKVWLGHAWTSDLLDVTREQYCQEGTWDNKCAVPTVGYFYANQTQWCEATQDGATDCTDIQDEALSQAQLVVQVWLGIVGIASIAAGIQMTAAMFLTVRLVTVPIIMRSMQSAMNYLMAIPVCATLTSGWALESDNNLSRDGARLISPLFYLAGIILAFNAVLGLIAAQLRYRWLLALCIFGLTTVLFIYVAIVALSFYEAFTLTAYLNSLSKQSVDKVFCESEYMMDCCCCETDESGLYGVPACPEWNNSQIASYAGALLQFNAVVTIVCAVIVFCGLLVSCILRRNLKGYRCERV